MKYMVLIIIMTLSVYAAPTEQECIDGGGNWVIPECPPDAACAPASIDTNFCKCKMVRGHYTEYWNESLMRCIALDNQRLCERTNGRWINGQCECNLVTNLDSGSPVYPTSTGKWVDDIGCQFIDNEQNNDTIMNYIVLVGLLTVLYFLVFDKGPKRKRK